MICAAVSCELTGRRRRVLVSSSCLRIVLLLESETTVYAGV